MAKPTIKLSIQQIHELCKIAENEAFFRKEYPELFEIPNLADAISLTSKFDEVKLEFYPLNPDIHWEIKDVSVHGGKPQQVLIPSTKEAHF